MYRANQNRSNLSDSMQGLVQRFMNNMNYQIKINNNSKYFIYLGRLLKRVLVGGNSIYKYI